ncbi:MAG: radical SAM family heme chaperone HemW [Simkaniaceae bacterium]
MPIIGEPHPKEVSLYFHIPFCNKKCPYCHFYVHPNLEHSKDLLLDALLKEWQYRQPLLAGRKISSIYFGGGTPTLFGAGRLKKLLSAIFHSPLDFAPDLEMTIEANPENIIRSFAEDLRSMGFNRISIGAQSLDASLLQILGRDHAPNKIEESIFQAFHAGFENITIDLMYEVPNLTFRSWEATVHHIATLPIAHLSLYNLTFEERTPFFYKEHILKKQLPSEADSVQMLDYAIKNWQNIGLERYEISAFAKKGFHSRHNTGYWLARPFLGFGPSAFSYFAGRRFRNIPSLKKYAEAIKSEKSWLDFEEKLSYPDNIRELLSVQLRLLQGVDLKKFARRHGKIDEITRRRLDHLIEEKYLMEHEDNISLSPKGLLFYDSVAAELV